MSVFHFSSRFRRSFRKRPERVKVRIRERLRIFSQDPTHELLKDHFLGGELNGVRSFSVTGDLRVQYEYLPTGVVNLIDLGTHHELYE